MAHIKHNMYSARDQDRFALCAESKQVLDLAKHTVETAIEQGEEMAIRIMEANNA